MRENLLEVIPADTFRVWFDNIRVGHMDEDGCELLTPNEFSAIWIRDNYLDVIRQEADRLVGYPYSVELLGCYEDDSQQDCSPNRLKKPAKPSQAGQLDHLLHGRSSGLIPKILFLILLWVQGVNLPMQRAWQSLMPQLMPIIRCFSTVILVWGRHILMHAVAHQALNRNPACRIAYVPVKGLPMSSSGPSKKIHLPSSVPAIAVSIT